MSDFGLLPEPPAWAVSAGLPSPHEDECFIDYVQRIGLDPYPMLEDLHEQTICLANGRLRTYLQLAMRRHFDIHVDELARKHLSEERRHELEVFARRIFPQGRDPYRPL